MAIICKSINGLACETFFCDNNVRRILRDTFSDIGNRGASDGCFYHQTGFKRRRAFHVEKIHTFRNGCRLYKMRGGWYCIEKKCLSDKSLLPDRFEVTKAEANEIKATDGAAFKKIFLICRQRAY